MDNKKIIEAAVLNIVNNLLGLWQERFKAKNIRIEQSFVRRTEIETSYFSEIEVDFWDINGNLMSTISIIIFMNNEQVLALDFASEYIEEQIILSYNECK